ncbi:MAG: hypothetical protein QOK43_2452 [Acidimicrobiaceae bacterium]|nr:hypothetical protein [Acidimicrobiaceae bacterium]
MALALGLVVGVTAGALALSVVALPLFFFARAADPAHGTGRPFIRTGLVQVAVPVGLAVAATAGALAARWSRRGGRWRDDQGNWGS